jgi:hypothetical protein
VKELGAVRKGVEVVAFETIYTFLFWYGVTTVESFYMRICYWK